MLWEDIKTKMGGKVVTAPGGRGDVLLLPVPGLPSPRPSYWMITQYRDRKGFAKGLRHDEVLREFIAQQGVRFGFRETDRPPLGSTRQANYGQGRPGANSGKVYTGDRKHPVMVAVRPEQRAPGNRLSDRDEDVRLFWATQTLQSHHVVEFNQRSPVVGRPSRLPGHSVIPGNRTVALQAGIRPQHYLISSRFAGEEGHLASAFF